MNKKTIKKWISGLWAKHYRLAVWTKSGKLTNFVGESRDVVFSNARFFTNGGLEQCAWTLYKTGRFYLPEREVDRSNL